MRRRWILLAAILACGGPPEEGGPAGAVRVIISPQSVNLSPGASQRFTATVTGSDDARVRWSAQGGSIGADGVYTAPAVEGTWQVTATSMADAAAVATASVVVAGAPAISITLDPLAATVRPGGTQQFSAVVHDSPDQGILWSIDEPAGGTVDGSGLYTAPSVEGTYHLAARSHADPTRAAHATISVSAGNKVTVAIDPASISLRAGDKQQFTAAVAGTSDASVTWAADLGSIDQAGLYTAPAQAATAHVTATSHADPGASASAVVTVVAATNVAVTLDPQSPTVALGASQQFTAHVTGTADTRVAWSVAEGAAGGSITTGGLYTPSASGVWHVVGTSVADASASASTAVTVPPAAVIEVSIDPATVTLPPGATQVFRATVTGSPDQRVIWSVEESGGGQIDTSGLYTAPTSSEGTFHVVATSVADSTKAARAIVNAYDDLIDGGGQMRPSIRAFALWWGPATEFPADMARGIESLLSHVGGSTYLSSLDQYLHGSSATVAFAGSLSDTSDPPANGPTDLEVGDEACRALDAAQVTPGAGDVIFVFPSRFPASTGFCAWHSYGSCHGLQLLIAFLPNPQGTGCNSGDSSCNSYSAATNSVARFTAHELAETITNPVGSGWQDSHGAEVADKCTGVRGCVALPGGVKFQLQALYSNAIHACTF